MIKGVAAVYNRYSYDAEKRAAMTAWARHIEAIVSGLYRGSFDELLGAIAGSRVASLESREPTLEEVFLSYYSGAKA